MREVKSLDQLYQNVKDYDTVLTAEAALADALNRRLDRPVKGPFASTPGRLASTGHDDSRKEVFLKAVEETDYSWKQISYAVDKIFEAWKHTGELEKILDFEKYDDELFHDIIKIVDNCKTSFHSVESFEVKGEVAVVNYFQFNKLDRSVLPDDYDTYSLINQNEQGFNEFNIFESSLDLVNSLVKNIERIGPENTGIVVRPDSRYQSLLESYLKSKTIDYVRSEGISEDPDMRVFLSLLETGTTNRNLRVRDVKPLQEALGLENLGEDNIFLESTDSELKEFINVLEYMDFDQALVELEEIAGRDMSHIQELLEDLEIGESTVTREKVEKLTYFISNFDSKVNEENTGVLLADPKNASVIDRPVVFLLGMSNEWNEKVSNEPWIDETWFEEKNLREFEILASSGDNTIYMVEDREFEEDIKPCFYIDEIVGENIENFRQLPHSFRGFRSNRKASNFEKEDLVEREEIRYLSQSRLNDLARSPKLFYMSNLISEAEEESLKKGQLFHDFAEIYFNYPNRTEEKLDEITSIFAGELEKIVDQTSMIELRTEIKHGLENLMDFLEPETKYSGEGYRDTDSDNFLAEKLGLELSTSSTEMYFKEDHMKGKVDLIESENHLVDFKSGRKKSVKDIVKASRPETFEDVEFPDFQALMYLAHHSKFEEGEIEFSFVYFLDGLGDRLGNGEEESMTSTVKYMPESFEEKVRSQEMFEFLIRDVKKGNKRRKTLEKLGFSEFSSFFAERDFPDIFEKDEIEESKLYLEFEEFCVENVGDYKYVRKGVKSSLRKMIEYRNTRYFKEDVENIKTFVEEKIEDIESYEENSYPVGDRDVSELGKEDLIV